MKIEDLTAPLFYTLQIDKVNGIYIMQFFDFEKTHGVTKLYIIIKKEKHFNKMAWMEWFLTQL